MQVSRMVLKCSVTGWIVTYSIFFANNVASKCYGDSILNCVTFDCIYAPSVRIINFIYYANVTHSLKLSLDESYSIYASNIVLMCYCANILNCITFDCIYTSIVHIMNILYIMRTSHILLKCSVTG